MDQKKSVLLVISALILGILIGGIGYSILKPGSGAKSTEEATESSGKQLYSCGMHPDVISEEPGNCPICGMKLTPIKSEGAAKAESGGKKEKGKILYWRAPMDPTYISDKPGKSPMGMDLVPVYEGEEGSGTGSILIDPVTEQNMGVKTAPAEKRILTHTIRTVGVIKYDEENLYSVNAKISGWIEKLYVEFTGQEVRKDQPLLEIYSPELVSAQEEYLLAYNNYQRLKESSIEEIRKNAETLLQASRNRLLNWDISEKAIDDLEKRAKISKTMTLTSPANGIVTRINATEGSFVKEGTDLYNIADLSTVWVDASVYEYEIPFIKLNMPAQMELSYLPGKVFKGKVTFIYPYLDKKARDLKVRLEFPNTNYELKPDMYANVTIESNVANEVLAIPAEAVIRTGERNIVFIEREPGKFEPREVKIGRESEDGFVEVISGVLSGEQVVTSGQFLLDSESKAQEAIRKMLEAKKHTEMKDQKSNESMKEMPEMNEMKAGQMSSAESEEKNIQKEKKIEKNVQNETKNESLALYTCSMHPEFVTDDPNQRCPECEMKLIKKKDISSDTQLYTCPMHPEFVTDDPDAICSICEMKLVKKEK